MCPLQPSGSKPSSPAWKSPRSSFTLADLGVVVRRHRADDSVTKALSRLLRAHLGVVKDIGLLQVGPNATEGRYRLIGAVHESR